MSPKDAAGESDHDQETESVYDRIYDIIRLIPAGQVASYGQIGRLARCGPRQVGYALANLPSGAEVPWHRVVNSQGRTSPRKGGDPDGDPRQTSRLRKEGVRFDRRGRIDFELFGWPGPGWAWLEAHGFDPGTF